MRRWHGFYVEGDNDVNFCSVIADNNRRQGLSIIKPSDCEEFNLQKYARIDIEPDTAEQHVSNVRTQFLGNAGPGIAIVAKRVLVSEI
jgi:hypothetical protein